MNGLKTLSIDHINGSTPMGGNLISTGEGATFLVWAPSAREVRVLWDYNKTNEGNWVYNNAGRLQQTGDGFWGGFVSGLKGVRDTCIMLWARMEARKGLNAIRTPVI